MYIHIYVYILRVTRRKYILKSKCNGHQEVTAVAFGPLDIQSMVEILSKTVSSF